MYSYISPEQRVPQEHPLRTIREIVDAVLKELSPEFARLYAANGRPSIAPEKLLRALLLQVLYTVRSERLLMEQLDYNLLFRWFVGLNMDEAVWVPTVFSKNRERLLEGDMAGGGFFGGGGGGGRREIVLGGRGVVGGGREVGGAGEMAEEVSGERRVTLGGDKGYDQKKLVEALRRENVTPHVARNHKRPGGSAIDGRTARHAGYEISQRVRKRVEEIFGWMKTIGLLKKLRHRGQARVEWMFTFTAAAYNLVRARNLLAEVKA